MASLLGSRHSHGSSKHRSRGPLIAHRSERRAHAHLPNRFAIPAVSIFVAYGGDGAVNTGPPPPVAISGNFTMYSISDSLRPHWVPHPQFEPFHVESGHMNLNADLSYTYEASGKLSGTTAATANDSAAFSKFGSTITFTSNFLHGMTYAATASDSSRSVVLIGAMLGSTDNTIPVLFLKER